MQPQHSPSPNVSPDTERFPYSKKQRLVEVSPPPEERRARPSTSLPSIHHLHPELPPPPNSLYPSHHHSRLRQFETSARNQSQYALHSDYALGGSVAPEDIRFPERVSAGAQAGQSAASSSSVPERSLSTAGESDQEGMMTLDQTGPPKKKRRRQALSCTECKRRKIKCDRAHPCGPCQRRGEEERCQWHVVEPVEKYVTRSEWDEIRGRCRTLEDRCARMESLIFELRAKGSPLDRAAGQAGPMTDPGRSQASSGPPSSPLLTRPLKPNATTSSNHTGNHHFKQQLSPIERSFGGMLSPTLRTAIDESSNARSPTREAAILGSSPRTARHAKAQFQTSPRGTAFVSDVRNHQYNHHHQQEHGHEQQQNSHCRSASSTTSNVVVSSFSSEGNRNTYREPPSACPPTGGVLGTDATSSRTLRDAHTAPFVRHIHALSSQITAHTHSESRTNSLSHPPTAGPID